MNMSPAQRRRRRLEKGESRPKRRKGAGRRTTVDDLPEHVFEQILSRLGPYSPYLVRAAATCRRWFRVVADAGFLARLATTTHAGDYRTIDGRSVFVPSSPLDDDGRRRFSLDFLPDSESWELADSRDSLLLLSKKESAYESCSLEHNYDSCRCCDVVVCDPLRARYQVIPWPLDGVDRSDCIGLFLAGEGDGRPSSMSNFRIIVVIQQTEMFGYTIGIDGVWHSIREEYPRDLESITGDFFAGRANGSLYWGLEEDVTMVIVLDEATWTLSLARLLWGLSSDKTARIIGGQDGMLRVVRLIGKNLYVFAQTRLGCNGDNHEWVLEKRLCLSNTTIGLPGRDESLLKQKIVIIRANDEYILLSLSDGTWAFTVELDMMRVESEHPRNNYTGKVYPYVLPWPPVLSDLSKEQYAVVRRHKCDRK